MEKQLIEALAKYSHRAWTAWMRHMLKNWTPENLAKWMRQMDDDYESLSEQEKESDRKQAIEIIAIIQEAMEE